MKNEWVIPDIRDSNKIGTINAIKHRVTGELCLFGKHGEIWAFNDKMCYAVITSTRVAHMYTKGKAAPQTTFDETLVKFPMSELEMWAKRLGVKKPRSIMLRYANGE